MCMSPKESIRNSPTPAASASQNHLSRIRLARKEKIDDGGRYEQHILGVRQQPTGWGPQSSSRSVALWL